MEQRLQNFGWSLNGKLEDGLFAILKVCYDSLVAKEKEMFLDLATCFLGGKLEVVKRACGWALADSGWENLVGKRFVTVTTIGKEGCMNPDASVVM